MRALAGIDYIAQLLTNPYKEFTAWDLETFSMEVKPEREHDAPERQGTTIKELMRENESVKKAVRELEIAREVGDNAGEKKKVEELRKLLNSMGYSLNPKIGKLIFKQPYSRRQDRVRKNISNAKNKLIMEIPDIQPYLKCISVFKGRWCYAPKKDHATWVLS
ncbi:MAG: hypothetical protein JRI51_05585 [Deltaproteobacteria bacterium]|nr:hypothetical protein [Deltaproteobacteria bacterium]